jgi:hypothetical protein
MSEVLLTEPLDPEGRLTLLVIIRIDWHLLLFLFVYKDTDPLTHGSLSISDDKWGGAQSSLWPRPVATTTYNVVTYHGRVRATTLP